MHVWSSRRQTKHYSGFQNVAPRLATYWELGSSRNSWATLGLLREERGGVSQCTLTSPPACLGAAVVPPVTVASQVRGRVWSVLISRCASSSRDFDINRSSFMIFFFFLVNGMLAIMANM